MALASACEGDVRVTRLATRTERRESLREEIAAYVAQQERTGIPTTFVEVARGHREVCAQGYADTGDRYWWERVGLLDEILAAEGSAPDPRVPS